MKIIEQGVVPEKEPPFIPWWVGRTFLCGHCFAKIELEADDNVERKDSFTGGGEYITCPNCTKCIDL